MSKEAWFRHFERVRAERPELTDEHAAEVARDEMVQARYERADNLRKARIEDGFGDRLSRLTD